MDKLTKNTNASQEGKMTAPDGWKFKIIGYVALAAGVIGAGIAWYGKESALASLNIGMGLPMLLTPYLIVPRVKKQRVWQGFVTGIISGLIAALILLVIDTAKYSPALQGMGIMFLQFVVGAFATSWLSSMVAKWTDRYTTNKIAQNREKKKLEMVDQYKGRYRMDASGKPVRIHHKKKKKH